MEQIESKWTKVDRIGPKWIKLDRNELKCYSNMAQKSVTTINSMFYLLDIIYRYRFVRLLCNKKCTNYSITKKIIRNFFIMLLM